MHIAEAFRTPFSTKRVHIAEEIVCQTRSRLRSLLGANEEADYRSAVHIAEAFRAPFPTKRVHIAEEILCQTRSRLRSLLGANEEADYRSAVQNLPAICARKKRGGLSPTPTNLSKKLLQVHYLAATFLFSLRSARLIRS